jgi:hypothetical protein
LLVVKYVKIYARIPHFSALPLRDIFNASVGAEKSQVWRQARTGGNSALNDPSERESSPVWAVCLFRAKKTPTARKTNY